MSTAVLRRRLMPPLREPKRLLHILHGNTREAGVKALENVYYRIMQCAILCARQETLQRYKDRKHISARGSGRKLGVGGVEAGGFLDKTKAGSYMVSFPAFVIILQFA